MHHRDEDEWNAELRERGVRFLLWLMIVGLTGALIGLLARRWLGM